MDIVVCFALFLAAMLFCLVKGFSLAWALVPALIMLILPLLRVPSRRAMAISAAAAFVITVTVQGGSVTDALRIMVVGYHPTEGLLASVVSGGGRAAVRFLTGAMGPCPGLSRHGRDGPRGRKARRAGPVRLSFFPA